LTISLVALSGTLNGMVVSQCNEPTFLACN
jgi:hypothetical protein